MPTSLTKRNYNTIRKQAAELSGLNPHIADRDLCERLNITRGGLATIKKDRRFHEMMEATFVQAIQPDMLIIDVAMIKEAQAGNVQAARYLGDKYGKFVKKFQIEVKSPFELFKNEVEADDVEFEEIEPEIVKEIDTNSNIVAKIPQDELPLRDERNNHPTKRAKEERKHIRKRITRIKQEYNPKYRAKQKDRYYLRKRAIAVGLEPLPSGRPKNHEKNIWLKKLYKLEAEAEAEKKKTPQKTA